MRRAHLGCCVERGEEVPTQRRLGVPSFSIGRCLPMFLMQIIYMDHLEVPRSCISEQMGWFAPHRDANAPPLRQGGRGIVLLLLLLHVSSSRCKPAHLPQLRRHPPPCFVATPPALPLDTVVAASAAAVLQHHRCCKGCCVCARPGHLPQLRRPPPSCWLQHHRCCR